LTFEPGTLESQSETQDSDSSLVYTKNFSIILPSSGLGPGPGNLSQNGQKPTQLMTSLTKTTEIQKFFFTADSSSLLRVWTALQHNYLVNYGVLRYARNRYFTQNYQQQRCYSI